METLKGFTSKNFPYRNLKKVSDLIYFEGPFLSHFQSETRDYLYLWVDNNELVNRWLIIPITKELFKKYLTKKISLFDIIENLNDYVLFTDLDNSFKNTSNIVMLHTDIPKEYLPSHDSYFTFLVPDIYNSLVESEDYMTSLLEKSIHIKIEEKVKKYKDAIKMSAIMDVFKNVKSSLTQYFEVNFKRDFNVTAFDNFDKVLHTIVRESDLLVPNLKQGSFCASLVIDTVMSAETSPLIQNWRNSTFENFKKEVFDLDYTDDKEIGIIEKKYNVDERKAIYTPIIETFKENNDYKVTITDRTYSRIERNLKPISKQVRNKLVPKKPALKEEQEEQLHQIIALSKKSEGENGKSSKKVIIETKELENFTLIRTTNTIYQGEEKLFLKDMLEYKIQFDKGDYSISYPDLSIFAYGKTFASVKADFFLKIIQLYKRLFSSKKDDLSVSEKKMKEVFEELISMTTIN
jgi:hypothetical protein